MTDDLRERIAQLERDKRWWKGLATATLSALAILLLLGGSLTVYQRQQAQLQQRRAFQAAAEAQAQRDAAQQQRKAAEAAQGADEKGQGKKP